MVGIDLGAPLEVLALTVFGVDVDWPDQPFLPERDFGGHGAGEAQDADGGDLHARASGGVAERERPRTLASSPLASHPTGSLEKLPISLRGLVLARLHLQPHDGDPRMPKRMHLAFDISYIHMDGRWRMPGAWPGETYPDVAMFEEIARIAERGCSTCCSRATAPAFPAPGAARATRPCAGASPGHARTWPAHGGDVAGDEASRLRRHLFDDLHASLLPGAAVQLARPRHRRADRVQRHHLHPALGFRQLWL